jgi:hypothetical protein
MPRRKEAKTPNTHIHPLLPINQKKFTFVYFENPNGNTKQHNAPLYTENSVHGSPDMRCRYAFLVVQREAAAQKSRPPLQDRRISRDRA